MSQSKAKGNKYSGNSAAALRYNPDKDYSPVVVASGHGKVADRIIEMADDNGIPVYRDDSTAALLTMLDIGKPIPKEMYEVVAAIYVEILKAADEVKNSNI